MPQLSQIQNFIAREKKPDGINLTSEDLRNYFEEHSAVPEDENAFFCSGFQLQGSGENVMFCLSWTTSKLAAYQRISGSLQIDSTYKLNWNGFPLMV